MESGEVTNALSNRRLPVFKALYSPVAASGSVSRHIDIEGVTPSSSETDLLSILSPLGSIQCLDLQDLAYGHCIVSYYDLRHAESAYKVCCEYWDCHYLPSLPYPEYADFIVFQDYGSHRAEEIVEVMEDFGEVKGYMCSGSLICIQFYDTRAQSKAHSELSKLPWLEHYEDTVSTVDLVFLPYTPKTEPARRRNAEEELSNSTMSSPGNRSDGEANEGKTEVETAAQTFGIDSDAILTGKDLRTSVMIKNIPNKYSQQLLLETIDKDFRGKYDFFYLPIDFKNKCNVGYAFLNFLSPTTIIPFLSQFKERKWELFNSSKVCEVTYGRIQGRSALIQHFQTSSVMSHEDARVKPVILPLLAKWS